MRIARIIAPVSPSRKRGAWAVYGAACLLAAPVAMMQLAIAQPSVVAAAQHGVATAAQANPVASTQSFFSVVPATGRITSPFGEHRPPPTEPAIHTGIDYAGAIGAPVVAPAAGRVTTAEDRPNGYGKMIEIDHGGGIVTLYAHLSALEVSVGQQVSAGQEIGKIGDTGRAITGPHLHFEVQRDGAPVDPTPMLPH